LIVNAKAPELHAANAGLLILFAIGATLQVRRLRRDPLPSVLT
jgi:hypothetical protein